MLLLLANTPAGINPPTALLALPARQLDISLPVSLDDRYLGDISVSIVDRHATFDARHFLDLVTMELTPEAIDQLRAHVVRTRLTPETASTSEVHVIYDETAQEIRISTQLGARQRKILKFGTVDFTDPIPVEPPAPLSAFLNIAGSFEYIWEDSIFSGRTGRQPLDGSIEAGGRILGDKGLAFISRFSFDESAAKPISRTETRFVYDNVEHLVRVTAGDLRYRGANLQSLPRLAGISVERFFGLEPTRVFRPVSENRFELERSSTVDVRINGITVRQLLLQPGRYDLRDLPLSQGANDLDLVVRDDTGREQRIRSRNFFDFDLLVPGYTDFSFALGVRARLAGTTVRYRGQPVASGLVHHGFSASLTIGADIQGDREGGALGASILWASPIGIWRLEATGSTRSGIGWGQAFNADYKASGQWAGNRWRWTFGAALRTTSRTFATIDDAKPQGNEDVRQAPAWSADSNFQIAHQRWTFSGSVRYEYLRAGRANPTSTLLGFDYSISPQFTVGSFGRYTRNNRGSEQSAFLQLTWHPGQDQQLRATYDSSRNETQAAFLYAPPRRVGSTSIEASLSRAEAGSGQLRASGAALYTGNRFTATFQHDALATTDNVNARIQTSRFSFGSGLAFAGGTWAIGRPVGQSFAILTPHPSLKGKKIMAEPRDQGAHAQSGKLGPAMIPDLSVYSKASLSYDVENLPLGYDLGAGQFTLRPPLYAGYRLIVGSGSSVTITGHVVEGADGTPVPLIGGTLQSIARPDEPPVDIFTNRNGRLAATGLREGHYTLTLNTDPPFTTTIRIPADSAGLIDIGDVRITAP
jgi:outer membrane usher protein